jgi:hypothetical protein
MEDIIYLTSMAAVLVVTALLLLVQLATMLPGGAALGA